MKEKEEWFYNIYGASMAANCYRFSEVLEKIKILEKFQSHRSFDTIVLGLLTEISDNGSFDG